jgi:hypothetical protein
MSSSNDVRVIQVESKEEIEDRALEISDETNRRFHRYINEKCMPTLVDGIIVSMFITGVVLKFVYGLECISLGQIYQHGNFPSDLNKLFYIAGIIMYGCGILTVCAILIPILYYAVKRNYLLYYFKVSMAYVMPFISIPSFVMCCYITQIYRQLNDDEKTFIDNVDTRFIHLIKGPILGIFFMDIIPALSSAIVIVSYPMMYCGLKIVNYYSNEN